MTHETDYQRARRQRSEVKKHGVTGSTPKEAARRIKEHTGFDSDKRWGNSAVKGVGVNSPAMMEARKNALAKKIDVKHEGRTKFSHNVGITTPHKGSNRMRWTKTMRGHELDRK